MKRPLTIAACAALLTIAAGCGSEKSSDGLTAEQREKLNQIAENTSVAEPEVVDTSADSLVVDDALKATENGGAPLDGAATAPASNVAAGNRQ